jgi:hypothetical protein
MISYAVRATRKRNDDRWRQQWNPRVRVATARRDRANRR